MPILGNVTFLWFGALIAAGVAFLMWTYRASQNLVAMGVQLRYSSGWAVGCWFIPIISLFRPYQAMKEIWKRSHPNRYDPDALLVDVWWALWLRLLCRGLSSSPGIARRHRRRPDLDQLDPYRSAVAAASHEWRSVVPNHYQHHEKPRGSVRPSVFTLA